MLVSPLLPLVLGVDDAFDGTPHQVEPTILRHEDAAETDQTPSEGINGKDIDILADAMISETYESFDAEHQN